MRRGAKRIANRDARDYVTRREEFDGSSMYARWMPLPSGGRVYVVYSYGRHFPMYAYCEEHGRWFGNNGRWSRTTSKHQGQARPSVEGISWFDTAVMQEIERFGIVAVVAERLAA